MEVKFFWKSILMQLTLELTFEKEILYQNIK